MNTQKVERRKRDPHKSVVVSENTHTLLKAYANKMGYKTQYIADEAIYEYLKRKEQSDKQTT